MPSGKHTTYLTNWHCANCHHVLLLEGKDLLGTYTIQLEDLVPGGIGPDGKNQVYCLECAEELEIWQTYYGEGTG